MADSSSHFWQTSKIIDISPVISEKTAVFPGDTPFSADFLLKINKGHNIDLSTIKTTVHIGAHTDAPSHYHADGVTMEQRGLHYYLGPAQVIEVNLPRGARIYPKDLTQDIKAPRVLIKTSSFPDPNNWNGDFNSLSKELIDHLAHKKVILVGIDTPSVDPADDKVLESHHAIYKNDMAILEGIVLNEATNGLYDLVCLPLKIAKADASPVRAILLKHE